MFARAYKERLLLNQIGRALKNKKEVMSKTIGEQRVRTDFNVTADDNVALIKKHTAELINICETLKAINPSGEKSRHFSLAQTNFEEAAMWAVKAATT